MGVEEFLPPPASCRKTSRCEQVKAACTYDEKEMFERVARLKGTTLSELIRDHLHREARALGLTDVETE